MWKKKDLIAWEREILKIDGFPWEVALKMAIHDNPGNDAFFQAVDVFHHGLWSMPLPTDAEIGIRSIRFPGREHARYVIYVKNPYPLGYRFLHLTWPRAYHSSTGFPQWARRAAFALKLRVSNGEISLLSDLLSATAIEELSSPGHKAFARNPYSGEYKQLKAWARRNRKPADSEVPF